MSAEDLYNDWKNQRRQENLENGAGFTPERARRAIDGVPDLGGQAIAGAKKAERRAHRSHRGGRSYNEGSDSEHDPYWNVPTELLSDEQIARNAREIAAQKLKVNEGIKRQNRERFSDPVEAEKEITRQRAIQRAQDEKKKRGY